MKFDKLYNFILLETTLGGTRQSENSIPYPKASSENGWTPEDRKQIKPEHIRQRAREIAQISATDRDDMEFFGPIDYPAFCLFLAHSKMPKRDGQWRGVSSIDYLCDECDALINVGGVPYVASLDDNPFYDEDEKEDGVDSDSWSFRPACDMFNDAIFTSTTNDKENALEQFREFLSSTVDENL